MTRSDRAADPPELRPPGDAGLLHLLSALDRAGYDFVAPTPATHALVCARKNAATDLRDVFGWSLKFGPGTIDPAFARWLDEAGLLDVDPAWSRSRVRVSRLDGRLFLHSAYPTEAQDAVFLGPDSYRFARLIRAHMRSAPAPRSILDLGTGAGVGGLVAAAAHPQARLVLSDLNPAALRLARLNAAFAGRAAQVVAADAGAHTFEDVDLALANPPFMRDPQGRTYRDGGDMQGAQMSLDWTLHTAERLAAGGRMILYTGSAIQGGRDRLRETLADRLPSLGCTFTYEEIDPDIFGDELKHPAYADVERIAAVGVVVTRRL